MRAPSSFEVRRIGPYKLREVVASDKWRRLSYRRIEATRDGKYVFSWSTWRAAERAIKQLVRNPPMPKILDRLVSQLKAKGMPEGEAFAAANKTLQKAGDLKPHSQTPTAKGLARTKMGAEGRAKARASKTSPHPAGDFAYSSKTNRATLRGKL